MSSILHQVPTVDAGDDPRTVLLKINGLPAHFKIHMGHDVSVLSETTFQQLVGITLKPTSKLLTGPSRGLLQVNGSFTGLFHYGTVAVSPAIAALKLASRVNWWKIRDKALQSRSLPRPWNFGHRIPHLVAGGCQAICSYKSGNSCSFSTA